MPSLIDCLTAVFGLCGGNIHHGVGYDLVLNRMDCSPQQRGCTPNQPGFEL